MNATTGSLLWSYTTGGAIRSSPTVANGVIYFGSDDVYALDAKTGVRLWNYIANDTFDSSPAVVNGTVYINGHNGIVYAFAL